MPLIGFHFQENSPKITQPGLQIKRELILIVFLKVVGQEIALKAANMSKAKMFG